MTERITPFDFCSDGKYAGVEEVLIAKFNKQYKKIQPKVFNVVIKFRDKDYLEQRLFAIDNIDLTSTGMTDDDIFYYVEKNN